MVSALATPARATDNPAPKPKALEIMPRGVERAAQLMRLGDFREAAVVLESALEKTPGNRGIIDLLGVCYERSKQYDKLISLKREQLTAGISDFQFLENFGHAHLLAGNIDSADVYFYRALAIWDEREFVLQGIAEKYHQFGHYEREVIFIDSARSRYDLPGLLAGKKGEALAALQQFGAATLEYLKYIEKDTLTAKDGENKIIAMIRFPESADTVMAVLAGRIDDQADNRGLQSIYGLALMERNRFDDAFAYYRRQDSLLNKTGGEIIHFMRESIRRGHSEYTIMAGEYLLDAHPRTTLINTARFEMANAHMQLGQFDLAEKQYLAIMDYSPRSGDKYEAMLQIGLLYKNNLHRRDSAKRHFRTILKDIPKTRYGYRAAAALADIFVFERQFDSATARYELLLDAKLDEDEIEAIEYALAEIHLFTGNFEEANTRLRRLMNTYPRGLYVNDAIQYTLLIGETADQYPDQMDLFSSAEFFRYIGQIDSLEYYLTKICRIEIPTLAPLSYYHLAELYRQQNRNDESMVAIDSLTANYPRSYYMPLGLKLKADILWSDEKTREEAKTIYRSLLEKYGSYPFAAEIRNLLRQDLEANKI